VGTTADAGEPPGTNSKVEWTMGRLKPGGRVVKPTPLFPRVDPSRISFE
jgi:hypothetical protein